MKRFLCLGGILVFGVLAGVTWGQTRKCITTEGCPKDMKPPACCQQPPCEFYEQLRTKTALQGLFSRKEIREQLKKKAGGDNKAAAKMLYDWVVKEAKKMGSGIKCPWQSISPPPSFETSGECGIRAVLPGGPEPMGRETALRTFNTCSEFVEAAYDHEQVHKDACFKQSSTDRINQGIEDFAREERAAYQKEIDSLRASLAAFWRACSPVADAATARKLARAGISVLKKKGSGS